MSHVKIMVDFFEDLTIDKRLSLSPLFDKYDRPSQDFKNEDDDDLLSYGSDDESNASDDANDSNATDDIKTNICTMEEEIFCHPIQDGTSSVVQNKSSLRTIIELSGNEENDDDDDHNNLVYSSDDSVTSPRTLAIRPQVSHDWTSNDVDALTPKKKSSSTYGSTKNDCRIDIINAHGQSPLTLSAISCLVEPMKMFVSKGCNVNLQDFDGLAPLHYVCMNSASNGNRLACLELLLTNDANVNCKDYRGCTPLHRAAANGTDCSDIIRALLKFKSCPNVQDVDGNTPLHVATRFQNNESIKVLVKANPCLSSCDCNIPRSTFINSESEEEEKLIERSPEDVKGLSSKSSEIWKCFFENIANNNFTAEEDKDKVEANYHLHDAIGRGDFQYVKQLLESGYDFDEIDDLGNTPLHIACQKDDLLSIIALVENGANVNCINSNNETPLSICLKQGSTRCSDYLHCHCTNNDNVLLRIFDMIHHFVSQLLKDLGNFTTSIIFHKKSYQTTQSIPEDVALALSKAKSNNELKVGRLEPPSDLKRALEKAGLKN